MKRPKTTHTAKSPKNALDRGDWHTAHTSMGMGDYYGTGVKAKLGKLVKGSGMVELNQKKLGTPPKSIV